MCSNMLYNSLISSSSISLFHYCFMALVGTSGHFQFTEAEALRVSCRMSSHRVISRLIWDPSILTGLNMTNSLMSWQWNAQRPPLVCCCVALRPISSLWFCVFQFPKGDNRNDSVSNQAAGHHQYSGSHDHLATSPHPVTLLNKPVTAASQQTPGSFSGNWSRCSWSVEAAASSVDTCSQTFEQTCEKITNN